MIGLLSQSNFRTGDRDKPISRKRPRPKNRDILGQRCLLFNTTESPWPRPNFKNSGVVASAVCDIYRGLIRVWLIVSEKSACLCLQCENSIGAKITPEKQGGRVWATTPTYVNFVTWLYANSCRWTRISRSRCQATNTTGNDVIPEATTPEFLKSVTWFWTSRHRWPSISRSHSRATDSFREIGLSLSPVRKFDWSKNHPRKTGRSSLSDHAHLC